MNIERFKEIYGNSFEKSEPFDSALFDAFGENIVFLKSGDEIVSMLFKIPCSLENEGKLSRVYYIYAAATDINARNKGFMSKLLKQVMAENQAQLFLKPADKKLSEYYKSLGFRAITAKASAKAQINVTNKQKQLSEFCDSCLQDFEILVFGNEFENISEVSFSYPME